MLYNNRSGIIWKGRNQDSKHWLGQREERGGSRDRR